ncbi:MAG TPA: ATP-binding protein [Pseudonocardia sp.]|nr:ATP-binding protein [Pseudonocardia sp.]
MISTIGLLAAVCLVVGAISLLLLRGVLIGQLDQQLTVAGYRSVVLSRPPPDRPPAAGPATPGANPAGAANGGPADPNNGGAPNSGNPNNGGAPNSGTSNGGTSNGAAPENGGAGVAGAGRGSDGHNSHNGGNERSGGNRNGSRDNGGNNNGNNNSGNNNSGDRDADGKDAGPRFLLAPGQAFGTLGAHVQNGQVSQAGVLDSSGDARGVGRDEDAAIASVPVDGRPHTMVVGSLGPYRLIALHGADGEVVVTGLSMGGVKAVLSRLALINLMVAGAGLVAAGAAATMIVRFTLRPLARVAVTAGRVAELPLDRGDVALAERVPKRDTDPRTEVGQVGAALNRMLEHVSGALEARHASETQLRQFLADASHELRTPLAAIRGYAELARRAGPDIPADTAQALRRVSSQTERMTSLVEDMFLLARLDAGRPLSTDAVDLSQLVVDSISDAHAAGPEHRWRLDIPDEAVTVTGDATRLAQVLGNLLTNARVHTPPGTSVTAALEATAEHAVLRVSDNGPGIPPALLPHVFGRFARGDTSRSRAAGSTGLGLAIAHAVTTAHGGTLRVSSVPGQTTFTVTLPRYPLPGQPAATAPSAQRTQPLRPPAQPPASAPPLEAPAPGPPPGADPSPEAGPSPEGSPPGQPPAGSPGAAPQPVRP